MIIFLLNHIKYSDNSIKSEINSNSTLNWFYWDASSQLKDLVLVKLPKKELFKTLNFTQLNSLDRCVQFDETTMIDSNIQSKSIS